MNKAELTQAIADGRLVYPEDDWQTDYLKRYPERLAYDIWSQEATATTLDGKSDWYEVIEDQPLQEDRGNGHDGNPLKVVFKVGDDYLVAVGVYESWDGEYFPDGFHDAELVNVPTWLPKKD